MTNTDGVKKRKGNWSIRCLPTGGGHLLNALLFSSSSSAAGGGFHSLKLKGCKRKWGEKKKSNYLEQEICNDSAINDMFFSFAPHCTTPEAERMKQGLSPFLSFSFDFHSRGFLFLNAFFFLWFQSIKIPLGQDGKEAKFSFSVSNLEDTQGPQTSFECLASDRNSG